MEMHLVLLQMQQELVEVELVDLVQTLQDQQEEMVEMEVQMILQDLV